MRPPSLKAVRSYPPLVVCGLSATYAGRDTPRATSGGCADRPMPRHCGPERPGSSTGRAPQRWPPEAPCRRAAGAHGGPNRAGPGEQDSLRRPGRTSAAERERALLERRRIDGPPGCSGRPRHRKLPGDTPAGRRAGRLRRAGPALATGGPALS